MAGCAYRVLCALGFSSVIACGSISAGHAAEATFGLYGLGSGAVGAGQLPPGGVYFTTALNGGYFQNSTSIPLGGLSLSMKGSLAPMFVGNLLAVIPEEILGGRLALSVTSGFGLSSLNASIIGGVAVQRSVRGWGAMDATLSAAMSWQVTPEFSHKLSVSQWLTTGKYQTGFYPIVGLNRPDTDVSWGATYMEPTNKIELSGTVGVTLEGYNNLTSYRSGTSIHFEEGISKHFDNGVRIGAFSYQYDQITGDSGSGAKLGPFKTRAVGVGPSFGYTTMINNHLVSFTLQAAHEVWVHNRLRATTGLLSATYKF